MLIIQNIYPSLEQPVFKTKQCNKSNVKVILCFFSYGSQEMITEK